MLNVYRICVPDTINLSNNPETDSFVHIVTETPGLFMSDVRWGKDLVTLRHSDALVARLKKTLVGHYWEMSKEDYELLRECVEKPSVALNPMFARKLIPYFDAILNATPVNADSLPLVITRKFCTLMLRFSRSDDQLRTTRVWSRAVRYNTLRSG